MKKIGDVTSTADKNGEWTNGNVAAGIPPTVLESGWLNSIQREILGVLTKAGIPQDKNNDNQLSEAISKIITDGNYATAEDLKKKLTKNENGADIPDKPKFIENLGLGEAAKSGLVQTTGTSTTNVMSQKSVTDELDKKFDKTGGKITGQTDIESDGGRVQTLKAKKGTSAYQELYLADVFAAWWGVVNSNMLTIENRVTGNKLTIGADGFKVDGKNIATADQLFGIGQTYKNLTASRENKVTYINTDTKPRLIYIESNRTGGTMPFSIDITVHGDRVAYRWTAADEVVSLTALVQPGESYRVNGGWGQPSEWNVINRWLELTL
ncbi:MAG: hypothetical protein RR510_13030 [Morganella sp. (in: enterobacteria)]|uniref:hypothetical protein n=1 Tax=Morganella morganii TaxID=582 RepID=UPI0014053F6A|nr:hypothetical protein [Morganella morganii]MBS9571996.1 hypothetical protein [Morganella morganii subsp. morganii]QIM77807.1 hypothetical protein F3L16_17920 [Morganella morganii subsp. morganii]